MKCETRKRMNYLLIGTFIPIEKHWYLADEKKKNNKSSTLHKTSHVYA